MVSGTLDAPLGDQLLRIALDPGLRFEVYEHLREYCHQCRNRLNSLKLSLYLAMRQGSGVVSGDWIEIDRHYQELETQVERVQFLCRPLVLSRVTLGLDLLMEDRREAWTRTMADQGRGLGFEPPGDRAIASFDVDWLGKAIEALVAWRAVVTSGSIHASLRWWVHDGSAHLAWEEAPGPTRTLLSSPGRPESLEWALPTIARIAEAHGGSYQVQDAGGWRLEVSWPSAAPLSRSDRVSPP